MDSEQPSEEAMPKDRRRLLSDSEAAERYRQTAKGRKERLSHYEETLRELLRDECSYRDIAAYFIEVVGFKRLSLDTIGRHVRRMSRKSPEQARSEQVGTLSASAETDAAVHFRTSVPGAPSEELPSERWSSVVAEDDQIRKANELSQKRQEAMAEKTTVLLRKSPEGEEESSEPMK
jgi:hypothetical protein